MLSNLTLDSQGENLSHSVYESKQKSKNSLPEVNLELAEYIYVNPPPEGVDINLNLISAKDEVWNLHRQDTQAMETLYGYNAEFEKYSNRLFGCSGWLKFGMENGKDWKLKEAYFCRVRYCPVCQWRRSLLWKAMMYQTYDELKKDYPTHRFIFLTLTIRNPEITQLRDELKHMNDAYKKMAKRKEFAPIQGWIRTTEVTRPKAPKKDKRSKVEFDPKTKNTHAHPHFHCILMVKAGYFKSGNYIKTVEWVRLWRECLGVDYDPIVDVRTIKPKTSNGTTDDGMRFAIAETLKYATKPSEMLADMSDPKSREWTYELTRQTHKMRFVASGGLLKNALKVVEGEEKNQDMITAGDTENVPTDDKRKLNFTYYHGKGNYIYNPIYND